MVMQGKRGLIGSGNLRKSILGNNLRRCLLSSGITVLPVPTVRLDASVASAYTDAGVTLATDGQRIQQWNDQSGNNNHFSQTDTTKQPLYKTNIQNGLPIIRFASDGHDLDCLKRNIAFTSNAITVFAVHTKAAAGGAFNQYSRIVGFWNTGDNAGTVGDYGNTNGWAALLWDRVTYTRAVRTYRNGAEIAKIDPAVAYGTFTQWTAKIEQGNCTLRQDGVETTGTTSTTAMNANQVLIGGSALSQAQSINLDSELNGDIAEIVIYNQVLNAAQISLQESQLKSKWGTP